MRKINIILIVMIFLLAIVSIALLANNNSSITQKIESCSTNTELLQKYNCLTELAIEENDTDICSSIDSEENMEICEYQYILKNGESESGFLTEDVSDELQNCYQTNNCAGYSYYLLAHKYDLDSEICTNITNEKVKEECMIYLAGYSKEELKEVLLENERDIDVNARIHGFYAITGFSCENIEFTLHMLSDGDKLMRFKAIQRLRDNKCYFVKMALKEKEIIDKIKVAYFLEEDQYVRAEIIMALGELSDSDAIPLLEEIITYNPDDSFIIGVAQGAINSINSNK
jgi:hypothetical protein